MEERLEDIRDNDEGGGEEGEDGVTSRDDSQVRSRQTTKGNER